MASIYQGASCWVFHVLSHSHILVAVDPPAKSLAFCGFSGKPISWQKVKVLTSKQNAKIWCLPLISISPGLAVRGVRRTGLEKPKKHRGFLWGRASHGGSGELCKLEMRTTASQKWLWVKNRYLKWNPGKWKHGPKPAIPFWW